ncbi:MAG TPA: hypothetical protein PLQ97_07130 [Myxococcota bacterium]|nr:hypothetical protein [Myxococcota bacterium]HQK50407.1 hypothetical protein [Myxococcota bacterium]
MGETRVTVQATIRGYLTAFVDLLGISNRLEALDRGALDGELDPALKHQIALIIFALDQFRKAFSKFYTALVPLTAMDLAASLAPGAATPEVVQFLQSIAPPAPLIHTFTDTVVVSVHLEGAKIASMYSALYRLVMGCAAASWTMLGFGIPVRGGISLGYGLVLDSGEVIGAGLVRAHRLEAKFAHVPRIVVDPRLLTDFQPRNVKPDAPVAERYSKAIWEETLGLLTRDARDGQVFVDFLGPKAFELATNGTGKIGSTDMIGAIDRAISERIPAPVRGESEDQWRVRSKWEWLDAYWKRNRALIMAHKNDGQVNQ